MKLFKYGHNHIKHFVDCILSLAKLARFIFAYHLNGLSLELIDLLFDSNQCDQKKIAKCL